MLSQEIYLERIEGEILNNIDLGERMFQLIVSAERIAKKVKPGQFVNIKVQNSLFPFIRRPYSVWNAEDDVVEFLIKILGTGSKLLCERKRGKIDLLGPLGKPFPDPPAEFDIVLIAGGTGVAPLMFYLKYYSIKRGILIYGGKRAPPEYLYLRMQEISEKVFVATEDGSFGFKGFVSELVKELINRGDIILEKSIFILCGPYSMLKAFEFLPSERTYVSMEGKMACGFGICMGCAVKKKGKKGYYRTCTEGPLFKMSDIEL
mgnify:CR=1 FL=1